MRLREALYWAAGPMNLAMYLWVLLGRHFVGAPAGWMVFGVAVFGSPLLLAVLVLTPLGYARRKRSQTVTISQACCYVAMWLAFFICGATIVDGGDAPPYESALGHWFGPDVDTLGERFILPSGIAAFVFAGVLGVLLMEQADTGPRPSSPAYPQDTVGALPAPPQDVLPGSSPRPLR